MSEINIFKIGGNVIDNPSQLKEFLSSLARIDGWKILVHGGGKEASHLCEKLGHPPKMLNGRRITDRDTLEIVTMVYAGLINKRIVAQLQSIGVDSIGLSGADGNAVKAKMRPSVPVDYGFVGDIDPGEINLNFISLLLEKGFLPVFSPIMHDKAGNLLNCNADSVATALAVSFAGKKHRVNLIYCFEKDGVLADINNKNSLIPSITPSSYQSLKKEGKINAGMLPKLENAFNAVSRGVASVWIKNSQNILTNIGTKISL